MASFPAMTVTNAGNLLLAKGLSGKTIQFTKIVLGDGQLNGVSVSTLTALISQKAYCSVTRKAVTNSTYQVGGLLLPANITSGFYWREVGLVAIDPDDQSEVLYAYANAGTATDYIDPNATDSRFEKNIYVNTKISSSSTVAITIPSSDTYVLESEVGAAGGVASLGDDGKVPDEQLPTTNDEPLLKDDDMKDAPEDTDKVPMVDSADGSKTKLLLWSAIKSLFAASIHASTHATGGSDPLKPGDIGAYTKEETVNDDTRKLLELSNAANPNDIFQKIILGTGKYAFGVTVKLSNGDAGSGLTLGGLTTFAGASPVTDSNGYALCVSTSKTPTLTISSPYADLKNVSQKLTADVGKVVTPVAITVGIISSKTLEVTSSSTIKFAFAHKADLFAVGGGAGGSWGGSSSYDNYGGGGGGYTKTLLAQNIAAGASITVEIGAGGSPGCLGCCGGTTTIIVNGTFISADGGRPGDCTVEKGTAYGGSGGSAGGGAEQYEDHNDNDFYYVGNGGTDGGTASYASGTSQGSTTRAFGESTGTLYAGGGGGYCGGHVSGTGGAGGGGAGEHDATYYGGGGGAGSTAVKGGHGYQGIALVRWKA